MSKTTLASSGLAVATGTSTLVAYSSGVFDSEEKSEGNVAQEGARVDDRAAEGVVLQSKIVPAEVVIPAIQNQKSPWTTTSGAPDTTKVVRTITRGTLRDAPKDDGKPKYNPDFFSSKDSMDKEVQTKGRNQQSNVYKHSSSGSLLNADPAFLEDEEFSKVWIQKWNYLLTLKETNLVTQTIFKEVSTVDSVSGYKRLSSLCWDAYTDSIEIVSFGSGRYWKRPLNAQSVHGKTSTDMEAYWQSVWKFCTKPNMNERIRNKFPDTWGKQDFSTKAYR